MGHKYMYYIYMGVNQRICVREVDRLHVIVDRPRSASFCPTHRIPHPAKCPLPLEDDFHNFFDLWFVKL